MAAHIVMAAGGTGGHLFPLLAVAKKLRELDEGTRVTFLGRRDSLEEKWVTEAGERFSCVASRPLRSRSPLELWEFLREMRRGRTQTVSLFREDPPDAVLGGGGFGSAPAILAARKLRIPAALLEINVFPGRATRFLQGRTDAVFLGWETSAKYYHHRNIQVVGVPLREGFASLPKQAEARARIGAPEEGVVLLVLGGSQGAASLNRVVNDLVEKSNKDIQFIFHLAGQMAESASSAGYRRERFWTDMPSAYLAADVALCRSGAGTCAELAVCGTPAVLVPLPHSKSRDQLLNAELLAGTGVARILLEEMLSRNSVLAVIRELLQDKEGLLEAKKRAQQLTKPDAAGEIARQLMRLCSERLM